MTTARLIQLSLDVIIQGCRDESGRERRDESGYCFELFRRAIEAGDQTAWAALDRQYRQLMLGWVYGYKSVTFTPDEADQITHEALERFWRTLTTHSVQVSTRFAHVGALLKYLNQCVIATILDRQRRAQRMARLTERLQTSEATPPAALSPEATALERMQREEHVRQVRQWVRQHVTDPQEQHILALSYAEELTPAQIAQRYPQEFPDAVLVRRLKERILKRARRALADVAAENVGKHGDKS